jgi:pimeloyl-ACP methyl ester carboxylesterase
MKTKIIKLDYKGLKLKIAADISNMGKKEKGSILFIHGLGCSKDSFKDVWDFSGFRNFRILCVDLLGFGDSSKPKDFSYTLKEHAEVCKKIIEKLNLKKINLVGHSMGGAVALLLIKKIPERIISFINLEGNLIGEDCGVSRKAISVPYDEFKKTVFSQIKHEIKKVGDKSSKSWYKWLSKSDSYGFYQSSKSLVKWSDSRKLLKRFINLNLKKYYIFGEEDQNLPIVKLLKGDLKIKISNSGHFMMIDNPKEFYQKLLYCLEKEIRL